MKRLLVVFLVLLALVGCKTVKNDTKIASSLNKRILASGIKGITANPTERGVTITAGELSFLPDSAEITDETKGKLDMLADLIKDYPDRKVLIEGHTANVGDMESQLSLSKARAQTVGDYFIAKGAVTADKVVVEGLGGTVPLGDNETEEGRAMNRRV